MQKLLCCGRLYHRHTGQAYAVKKFAGTYMIGFAHEAKALRLVTHWRVPRAVRLIRVCKEADEGFIITRQVLHCSKLICRFG